MKCERCKENEADVTVTETVNGRTQKKYLCSRCAAEAELIDPAIFGDFLNSGVGLISSLMGNMFKSAGTAADRSGTDKRCDLCGMSLQELMREGRAGCPRCYGTFERELERTVGKLHGDTVHKGKVPAGLQRDMDKKAKIEALRQKISEAVAAENYEEAARLRDEIREIEERAGDTDDK